MVGRILPPHKDGCALIRRTCAYATLPEEKDFTDPIKGKDLQLGEIILHYLDGLNIIT